jgi:NCAIR mutase (PurE)-related protein
MNPLVLRKLLDDVAAGHVTSAAALERLRALPFEDLDFARIDHHRALRCGFPEVIFGQGKTPTQVVAIFDRLAAAGGDVLATRVEAAAAAAIRERHPTAEHNALARTVTFRQSPPTPGIGLIGIACAGTADLPVAEEARVTAEIMGHATRTFYDIGVAGLHRLLAASGDIRQARVLIVVAGMEGALPSVVGGLVDCPVIAVPTSIGYGASFNGLAALLAMLNSCAAGVAVVNIDNGFGAAYHAVKINRLAAPPADAQPAS